MIINYNYKVKMTASYICVCVSDIYKDMCMCICGGYKATRIPPAHRHGCYPVVQFTTRESVT